MTTPSRPIDRITPGSHQNRPTRASASGFAATGVPAASNVHASFATATTCPSDAAIAALPPETFVRDILADPLRALEFPYIALTPGASFRGLHDSLVN